MNITISADREGQYAMSVKDQWRICFRFMASHAIDDELIHQARQLSGL